MDKLLNALRKYPHKIAVERAEDFLYINNDDKTDEGSDETTGSTAGLAALEAEELLQAAVALQLSGYGFGRSWDAEALTALHSIAALAGRLLALQGEEPVAPAVTGKPCACGCGKPVTSARPEAKYATGACRVRAHRAR